MAVPFSGLSANRKTRLPVAYRVVVDPGEAFLVDRTRRILQQPLL
jgi:hypothetical protein